MSTAIGLIIICVKINMNSIINPLDHLEIMVVDLKHRESGWSAGLCP